MQIALIWAMANNRVIGRGNQLPWRLPKDMQHFIATTMGKPVVMGRKQFESMQAPLPGRTNIVLTRDRHYRRPGIKVVQEFSAAVEFAEQQCVLDGQEQWFVIGGAEIYALGLELATHLYVTFVDADPEGDTFFPEVDWQAWREIDAVDYPRDDAHAYPFRIAEYLRS